ncbi:MAG TPA: PfkB family carbohydrate kinase [Candidatus Eremiobacteraeota bacterium]|nr:PfkB family carbohydrate kinase [Candidatus Eremiobacteraeota bacterium]
MGLIIVGSVALDDVKTSFGVKERVLGGAASFASVSASFFHKDVYLVGVVGGDFPKEHIEFFRSRNIDLKGLEVIENGKTFHWKGTYEYNMNQAHTLDTQLNVFQNFQPKIPVVYREAEFVFLANIDPDLQLDVLRQIKNPKFTACDTMNLWINQKKDKVLEVMKNTNMVFINDAEARQLCETYSLPAAAKHILNLGPLVVIIKKGEHGALLYTKEIVFSLPGFPLEEVKDPTGAGDTFAGGLMGFLAETGKVTPGNLKKGIVYASVMASYNVEDFSLDKMSKLKSVDIEWRYEAFKNLTSFE